GQVGGEAGDVAVEVVETGAFKRADRNQGGTIEVEKRAAHEVLDFQADYVEGVLVDQIGLGDHRDAARDGEEAADLKVLAGLGLDAFVGGDHQQDKVVPADAAKHVAYKTFVARDVDETKH